MFIIPLPLGWLTTIVYTLVFVNKTLQIHKMLWSFIVIKTIHEHTRMHRVSNTVYFFNYSYFTKSVCQFRNIYPLNEMERATFSQLLPHQRGNFITFQFISSEYLSHFHILRYECSKLSILYRFDLLYFSYCRI